jgi:3-hydroxybutyryl-CoA dehydrogenase
MSERAAIGVVGGGLMGVGIAEVCARAGFDVIVVETSDGAADSARDRLDSSLRRAVRSQRATEEQRDAVLARTRFLSEPSPLAPCGLVVEAVAEDEDIKLDVFRTLDEVVDASDAILASNTSSIPIMKLAMATRRPESVIGLHFFNPVPVLSLVELVPSLLTSDKTRARAESLVTEELGKQVIHCQDRAGFIVNSLLVPYILSAIRMTESGYASAEDIDVGMVQGCAHPMGPLRLADLIGLDTIRAIAESLYAEFKEPLYSPPPVLSRMVEAGLMGRKSGRGFYEYN